MCLTMAVFCGFRFRQKKKQAREKMFAEPESPDAETIQFYSTNGKMLQSRTKKMSKSSGSGGGGRGGKLVLGDGLAPFGGSEFFSLGTICFLCELLFARCRSVKNLY